jgi:hypothetical protein
LYKLKKVEEHKNKIIFHPAPPRWWNEWWEPWQMFVIHSLSVGAPHQIQQPHREYFYIWAVFMRLDSTPTPKSQRIADWIKSEGAKQLNQSRGDDARTQRLELKSWLPQEQ